MAMLLRARSFGARILRSPRSTVHQPRRLQSTAPKPPPPSPPSLALPILASFALGAAAYHLSTSPNTLSSIFGTKGRESASPVAGLNNTYGTTEDFAKAVQLLKEVFPEEDTVTTDPDDLETHGFSENDYHPGASPVTCYYCDSGQVLI